MGMIVLSENNRKDYTCNMHILHKQDSTTSKMNREKTRRTLATILIVTASE